MALKHAPAGEAVWSYHLSFAFVVLPSAPWRRYVLLFAPRRRRAVESDSNTPWSSRIVVVSRRVSSATAAELGNQSTTWRQETPTAHSGSPFSRERVFASRGNLVRLPAQVTHRSYGGAPGHPVRKTADLPENPGLPYQAARRPVKVTARAPMRDDVRPRVPSGRARRSARTYAPSVSIPTPKSAPVSQDSKRRGGSPPPDTICTGARTPFPRSVVVYPELPTTPAGMFNR